MNKVRIGMEWEWEKKRWKKMGRTRGEWERVAVATMVEVRVSVRVRVIAEMDESGVDGATHVREVVEVGPMGVAEKGFKGPNVFC